MPQRNVRRQFVLRIVARASNALYIHLYCKTIKEVVCRNAMRHLVLGVTADFAGEWREKFRRTNIWTKYGLSEKWKHITSSDCGVR